MTISISLPMFREKSKVSPKAAPDTGEETVPGAEIRISGIEGRTRISTDFGEVPAALLRRGDKVRTRDNRLVEIQRIERIELDAEFLLYHPDAAPIRVPEGAFAPGRPERDIWLAPDQMLGGGIDRGSNGLCRARDLAPATRTADGDRVTYFKLHLAEPCAVMSERVWLRAG